MGLVYRLDFNLPSTKLTVTSKKFTCSSEISEVKLKKVVAEFNCVMNSFRAVSPSVHIMNMSSMNLMYSRGCCLYVYCYSRRV